MRQMIVALFALALLGFDNCASAQTGLQRFESDIKPQLELKKAYLRYFIGTRVDRLRAC